MEVRASDVVLCEFYFSDLRQSKRRPVLVFKDNLPYDDFIAIAISSKIQKMQKDEIRLDNENFVEGAIPIASKLMVRKTFVVAKNSIVKKYGTINDESFKQYHQKFCNYYGCNI